MLICIVFTLDYILIKHVKAFIYESFHESKHQDFVNIGYGMLTLEYTDTQVQTYKKGKLFILYLLYLDSREDDGWEKVEWQKSGRFPHFFFPSPYLLGYWTQIRIQNIFESGIYIFPNWEK